MACATVWSSVTRSDGLRRARGPLGGGTQLRLARALGWAAAGPGWPSGRLRRADRVRGPPVRRRGPAQPYASPRRRKVISLKQALRACLSVRFQGFTPPPQYRPSASSRLWPARPAALCLPDPCRLGSDSHGGEVFSGKLLEFLTQTGSKSPATVPFWAQN